jgi:hypothetical protein
MVRLNARLNFYAIVGSDSGRNPGRVNGTVANPAGTPTNTKLSNYDMFETARIFPGFDGIAANGLKYGAALEIRHENAVAPGGGANGSISAATSGRGELYMRREMAYVGTDSLGFLRFGATDQPTALFLTGTFENFNDGGWNADVPKYFTANSMVTWPFEDVGALYTTTKVVYLSPSFSGFDGGISFEPNTGNTGVGAPGNGNCPYANTAAGVVSGAVYTGGGVGCAATSSTSVSAETARRRDTIDTVLRYRATVGGAGIALTAGYITSGRVLYNGVPTAAAQGTAFKDLGVYDFGGQVTYGGLAVGGHVTGGAANGGFNLKPAGQRDSLGWLIGTSYAIGPVIVGASYFNYQSAGLRTAANQSLIGNRNELGVAAGGTYTFAPGMNLYLSYLYGHRHQPGVDLVTASAPTTARGVYTTHNTVDAQAIAIGTQFRW